VVSIETVHEFVEILPSEQMYSNVVEFGIVKDSVTGPVGTLKLLVAVSATAISNSTAWP
jgi:hypothetical protein